MTIKSHISHEGEPPQITQASGYSDEELRGFETLDTDPGYTPYHPKGYTGMGKDMPDSLNRPRRKLGRGHADFSAEEQEWRKASQEWSRNQSI